MKTKQCTECGKFKLLGSFSKCSTSEDGLKKKCKRCDADRAKRSRQERLGIRNEKIKTNKEIETVA